jgi:UDP-hydrolysing UDP-N-acetyl-D-glucosamine 2-epimerase
VLTQIDEAEEQIRITLDALERFRLQTMVIYPNSDAGGRKMIRVIKEYERLPFIKSFKSIPHGDYLGLMNIASILIGNSSSGIIEAPSFKLPVVNIGIRQQGRERSINIIDVAHDKNAIIDAIKRCLYDKRFKERIRRCKNPYGNGHAGERIAKVLSSIVLDEGLLQKRITY